MSISRARLVELFQSLLEPLIGGTMGRASVAAQCRHLKIEGEEVAPEDVERLIDRVEKAMNVFVGVDQAQKMAAQLREQVAALTADP